MTEKEKKAAYYQANREKVLASVKAYRLANIETIRAKDRIRGAKQRQTPEYVSRRNAYCLKNKTQLAESKKRYAAKNRDRIKANQRRWYEDNRKHVIDRVTARQREDCERVKAYKKRWAKKRLQEHPEIFLSNTRARRAMKKGAEIGTDRKAYRAFLKFVRSAPRLTCYWCGEVVPKKRREVDHIVPIIRGGKDDVHNLCCSCVTCNRTKNDKPPEVFTGQYELAFC
jgi:5-methylcytosine-specific restriction protein A